MKCKVINLLKISLLPTLIHLFSITLTAQKSDNSIEVSAGIYIMQDHFSFRYEGLYDRWKEWIKTTPTFRGGVAYSRVFSEHLVLGVGVQIFSYKVIFENSEFRDGSGFINDLKPEYSIRNYLIPEITIGYTTDRTKKWGFQGLASFIYAHPFNSYDRVTYYTGEEADLGPYQSTGNYREGIMYGPSAELGVIFNPSRYLLRNWISYKFTVDAKLLFYTGTSNFNPKFLLGPEVAVMYNF